MCTSARGSPRETSELCHSEPERSGGEESRNLYRKPRRCCESGGGMRQYYVYIMASKPRTLYTGVTNDLEKRLYEHQHGMGSRFTSKRSIDQLL